MVMDECSNSTQERWEWSLLSLSAMEWKRGDEQARMRGEQRDGNERGRTTADLCVVWQQRFCWVASSYIPSFHPHSSSSSTSTVQCSARTYSTAHCATELL